MLNIADFVFIGLVVLLAIIGSARGLARSLFGLGSIVLSLVLAFTLYPVVSDFMSQSSIGNTVTEKVEMMFGQTKNEGESENAAKEKIEAFPNAIQDAAQAAGEQLQKSVSESVSSAAMNIISMLLVFIIVRFLLWGISKVLDIATKLPVIHSCNKIFGAAFGALSGVLLVYLLLGLLTFTTLLNTTENFGRTVQSSLLVSQMYENNILLYFLHNH